MGKEQFLQLLVAEMSNQDPLEPGLQPPRGKRHDGMDKAGEPQTGEEGADG